MRPEALYLQDILEAIAAIERFLQDAEKDNFLENELLQGAVIHKLTIIGEAAARLSDELKTRYSQTPWKRIIGLRNIAAHVYFSINWEAIWSTATTKLKPLGEQVLEILQNEFPDFKPEAED